MEVRDKYGTIESYAALIQNNLVDIDEDNEDIKYIEAKEKLGEQAYSLPNNQVIANINSSNIRRELIILFATYSMGKSVNEIRIQYPDIVSLMAKTWDEIVYFSVVQLLSIGILINADDSDFDKLVGVVSKDREHDFLIDFLIHYRKPEWKINMDSFLYKVPYQYTKEIILLAETNKQAAVTNIKKYLIKYWYRGHSDEGWYNIHKQHMKLHRGYWSFESGALVKILGLDDSSLKGLQYYPYDMVHWNENKNDLNNAE